jgi:hypothetical protein
LREDGQRFTESEKARKTAPSFRARLKQDAQAHGERIRSARPGRYADAFAGEGILGGARNLGEAGYKQLKREVKPAMAPKGKRPVGRPRGSGPKQQAARAAGQSGFYAPAPRQAQRYAPTSRNKASDYLDFLDNTSRGLF